MNVSAQHSSPDHPDWLQIIREVIDLLITDNLEQPHQARSPTT